jgi:predicted peroxiredoxin
MGYDDSDAALFYGIIIIIVVFILFSKKKKGKGASGSDHAAYQAGQIVQQGSPANLREMSPEALLNPGQARMVTNAIQPEDIKGIFVILTVPNPMVQMMLMSLSSQVTGKGKSVRILLCGYAGDLALKDGKETIVAPINKSPQMILKELIQKGVKVEVCPFYIATRPGGISDLIGGIAQANPSLVADGLLEPGVKIFSI